MIIAVKCVFLSQNRPTPKSMSAVALELTRLPQSTLAGFKGPLRRRRGMDRRTRGGEGS